MTRRAGHRSRPDKPVFVDHSGRRRRALTLFGSGLGVLLITGLIALLAGAFSSGPQSVPGWPDAAPHQPEGSPRPTGSPSPEVSDRPTGQPEPTPSQPPGHGKTDTPGNGNKPSKPPGRP